jgi:hypothetical protein
MKRRAKRRMTGYMTLGDIQMLRGVVGGVGCFASGAEEALANELLESLSKLRMRYLLLRPLKLAGNGMRVPPNSAASFFRERAQT